MSANSFGSLFKITTFGESHGGALGVVIDGCPAGVQFKEEILLNNLKRRRPGLTKGTSARNEADQPEILSGIFEGKTLGTPIAMIVRNQDARSQDYDQIKNQARIGHADDVWKNKFGHADHRGGGRSSGRETVARVMGGSVAQMLVQQLYPNTKIVTFSERIGPYEISKWPDLSTLDPEAFDLNFPDAKAADVRTFLEKAQEEGESCGGVAALNILSPPKSLGRPVFHKLKADLASACLSVGATTAFELGTGIKASQKKGTDFHSSLESSFYGGIRGGISTGETISLKIHFKPTSSIKDVAKKGRHDPCIVPRALPVLESMAWLVLADHILWARLDQI
jgi:chorismate synthase